MPGQRDVRVGVGDAGEDRVVLEQPLESSEVDLRGERQQHGREARSTARASARRRGVVVRPRVSTRVPPVIDDEEHRDRRRR